MDQPCHSRPSRSWSPAIALSVLVLGRASCLGCLNAVYRASRLPPELEAPPLDSARAINLSQLARPRANTEQIFVGDTLAVAIATGLERQGPNKWLLRVADDGTINVPLVGPVRVEGLVL